MKREKTIRVLVIDDSPSNRRAITQILEASPGIEVIDRAADGEEGLKKAHALKPDLITLDLEMPKLDGFSFLRLLMANTPTPVIVLSSYSHESDVFKALELGAFDFVAKPSRSGKETLEAVRAELLEKVRSVRQLRRDEKAPPPARLARPVAVVEPAPVVIAVGASTGGPPAIQKLVEALKDLPVCVLVCQHMPARFTHAFADRLDKMGGLKVSEAKDGDRIRAGHVFIAPGGGHLELHHKAGELIVTTPENTPDDRHAPSVDRLFESVAKTSAAQAFALVLTGMGNDGERGVRAIGKAGGEVWAESEETAAIFGMPSAAIGTGAVSRVLPLFTLLSELRARVKRMPS